jgi:hypothetical protein
MLSEWSQKSGLIKDYNRLHSNTFEFVHYLLELCSTMSYLFRELYDMNSVEGNDLQVDDVLKTVDSKNVFRSIDSVSFPLSFSIRFTKKDRWPIVHLAPLLVGPEGTTVHLGIEVRNLHSASSYPTFFEQNCGFGVSFSRLNNN